MEKLMKIMLKIISQVSALESMKCVNLSQHLLQDFAYIFCSLYF